MRKRVERLTAYSLRLTSHCARFALGTLILLGGCDEDDAGFSPGGPTRDEFGVVVNSIDLSLTVFEVEDPTNSRTVGLAPAGSPVSVATRGDLVLVPLGFFPAAVVVDLATDDVRPIALPIGSGATGAAFFDDTTAWVANPGLNTVSRIKLSRDTADLELQVSTFPQAVVATSDRIYVLNAELGATFQPAREGRVSVIDAFADQVIDTIVLSGLNPSAAAFGPDGLLYIVNSGRFGQGDGSLSVLNRTREVEHHTGFGEFPGDIAFGPDGNAYVSAFAYGIAVWDAVGDSFIRPPSDPLTIEGNTISSGVAFDSEGRLYTLIPGDCIAPSVALRAAATTLAFDQEIAVGVCPIAIEFTEVAR